MYRAQENDNLIYISYLFYCFPFVADERHKTTKKLWPLKEFPRFMLGGAYLMGRPAVPRLLAAAQVTPVLPLEDVYVTGLCAIGGKVELIPKKR
jgi:hypothetical protein